MLFKFFSVQTTYCQTPIYLWSERDVVLLLPVLWAGEFPAHCRLLRTNPQGPRGRPAWGFGGKPWTVQWVGWVGPAEALALAVCSPRPGPPGGHSGQNVLWLVITEGVWASPRANALQKNCTFSPASLPLG